MPLPTNFDTIRVGDIMRILASLNAQEYAMALTQLKGRFGQSWASIVVAQTTWQRDEWTQLVRDQAAFVESVDLAAGVPAVGKQLYIGNPAASGVNLLVFKVRVSSPVAAKFSISFVDGTKADVDNDWVLVNLRTNLAAPFPGNIVSASRHDALPQGNQIDVVSLQAGGSHAWDSSNVIAEVPPGKCLAVNCVTVNVACDMSIHYAEVSAIGGGGTARPADLPVAPPKGAGGGYA